ncbi:hypothetical protein GCM10011401_12460 [Nesterenkonia cremea]|uniref:Uncharacterized protein n=1 Tax=Nesterenkonia cremea TaxID=1882340 RepID=A0A917ENE7_9MICC|nr:hypothetical protein GCM10011401_12460 [Nesterenkonia cremea]
MAWGGVATGAASTSGSTPVPMATPAATGRKVAAVAVFKVISVRKSTPPAAMSTNTQTGMPARPSI